MAITGTGYAEAIEVSSDHAYRVMSLSGGPIVAAIDSHALKGCGGIAGHHGASTAEVGNGCPYHMADLGKPMAQTGCFTCPLMDCKLLTDKATRRYENHTMKASRVQL